MNWARLPCMQPHSGAPGWRASLKNIPPPDRAACIAAWYSHAGPEPSRLFGVTTWMPWPSHLPRQGQCRRMHAGALGRLHHGGTCRHPHSRRMPQTLCCLS